MRKVGLLGGTFDPPHIGHLLVAEEVYYALDLDEVWFVPSNDPPHKEASNTQVEHRVEMTQLAIKSNPHFQVSTIEMERSGVSYTYDTINELHRKYPDTSFYFIIGGDMVEYLPKWHRIDELMELVTFVGVKRQGHQLRSTYPVEKVDIPLFEVSSTLIRDRIRYGGSTKYLLPEGVEPYVKEHNLYE